MRIAICLHLYAIRRNDGMTVKTVPFISQ